MDHDKVGEEFLAQLGFPGGNVNVQIKVKYYTVYALLLRDKEM